MKHTLGIYGPHPDDPSGVARYITDSIPQLERHFSVNLISNSNVWVHPDEFDLTLYHLGNNALHRTAFRAAAIRPSVSIIHEYLHLDYYYQVWDELAPSLCANILLDLARASGVVAQSAGEFIRKCRSQTQLDPYALDIRIEKYAIMQSLLSLVHSPHVADYLKDRYPASKIEVVPFPVTPWCGLPRALDCTGERFGISANTFVFGSFGFIGEYKRTDWIIEAWKSWNPRPENVRLLLVGARQIEIDTDVDGVTEIGWLDDADFAALMQRVDCGIQLRFPSLGETSGPSAVFCAHNRPVILSDIAEMRGLGNRKRVLYVPNDASAVNALAAAMGLQYEGGRSCQATFDDTFSWGRWAECVRESLYGSKA